jgi:hypothetical protein
VSPLIGAGAPGSRATDEEEALVAQLSSLSPALDGEPDPEWQLRTRSRLVAMAAVRTPEPEPVSPVRRALARREGRPALWRTRLTAGLAGAAAAVVAVAGLVTVSADAKPGDALYGLKRGTEQTQLALAGDARGRTLLGFASTRLDELASVLDDRPSADLVADTLATMDTQTTDGAAWLAERAVETGASAPLDELAGWSAGQSAGLAEVQVAVPAAATADAGHSADLLARIDDRTEALRIALDCPAGPPTDGSDALGPVPGVCTAPAPSAGGGEPGAPVTEQPGTTAAPTPGTPSEGTTAPDPGSGSGPGSGSDPGAGSGAGSGSDSGPGSGSGDSGLPGLPDVDPGTGLPDLPLPSLPPLLPGSQGTAGGTGQGTAQAPAPGTVAPAPSSTVPLPGLDVCIPPLPVIGTC